MQRVVGPHFNDAVAAHLGSLDRVKARLALAGRIDELRALIQWEKDGGKTRLAHGDGGFLLDLPQELVEQIGEDRKSTRLNSSHVAISYAVFCLKKKHNT